MKEKRQDAKKTTTVPDYKTKDMEQNLNNYIKLYNESQAKLIEATRNIESLKVEVQRQTTISGSSQRTQEVNADNEARLRN